MGYFGSMYGGGYSANAPSANSMMFMPNAYGGYSTVAGGSPAGMEATRQLQNLRGMLQGARTLGPKAMGGASLSALAPYMQMAVSPPDMMNRIGQTFGGAGMNFQNILGQAKQYMENEMSNTKPQDRRYGLGGGAATTTPKEPSGGGGGGGGGAGTGGSNQSSNPLGFLSGIFGQYGSGGGGSFGSGWGYR